MSRDKGQRAEREVIEILQDRLNQAYGDGAPKLKRNLMQAYKQASSDSNADIRGLSWLSLEVKHQETLCLEKWWEQALRQATPTQLPVLFVKQNRKGWRVFMYGELPCEKVQVLCRVEVSLDDFLFWFDQKLAETPVLQYG